MKTHGIGRFVRDPELRYSPSGTAFCNFVLAYDTGFGEYKETSFIGHVASGKNAENIKKFFSKGDQIEIKVGELRQRTYEAKDGQKRSVVEVFVEQWGFCGSNKNSEKSTTSTSETEQSFSLDETDLPI